MKEPMHRVPISADESVGGKPVQKLYPHGRSDRDLVDDLITLVTNPQLSRSESQAPGFRGEPPVRFRTLDCQKEAAKSFNTGFPVIVYAGKVEQVHHW